MLIIKPAQIEATYLGECHGCLTANIVLDCKGWISRYGGYCLGNWFSDFTDHQFVGGYGAIIELMKAVGVDSWEMLKGQYVRVEFSNYLDGKILRIGHITKDQWFSFDDYFREMRRKHEIDL